MYFVSKKDITYFFVIWGVIAISSLIVILPIIYATSIFHLLWLLLGLLIIAFFIWLWFGTGYKIENDIIKIEHGPIKDTVKIRDIKKISKKKTLLPQHLWPSIGWNYSMEDMGVFLYHLKRNMNL